MVANLADLVDGAPRPLVPALGLLAEESLDVRRAVLFLLRGEPLLDGGEPCGNLSSEP